LCIPGQHARHHTRTLTTPPGSSPPPSSLKRTFMTYGSSSTSGEYRLSSHLPLAMCRLASPPVSRASSPSVCLSCCLCSCLCCSRLASPASASASGGSGGGRPTPCASAVVKKAGWDTARVADAARSRPTFVISSVHSTISPYKALEGRPSSRITRRGIGATYHAHACVCVRST
jgi:hypothetical protein